MFVLDPRLNNDGPLLEGLCDHHLVIHKQGTPYPWLVIVPTVAGASELSDLNPHQLEQLFQFLAKLVRAFKSLTGAKKMNVEFIGNICSQLHVHLIARKQDDPAWPAPVWVKPTQGETWQMPEGFVAELKQALVDV